jgi:hypothetical protein
MLWFQLGLLQLVAYVQRMLNMCRVGAWFEPWTDR